MAKIFYPEEQRKYFRIPFKERSHDFRGCDCGGLVRLIYKTELGVELPDWEDRYSCTRIEYSKQLEETVSTMLGELGYEVPCEEKQPFDVVSFSIHGHDVHVGLVVDKNTFIHILEGKTSVSVERFDSPHWRNRLTGCYRYKNLPEE